MGCGVSDKDGNELRVGDVVRVLGVPDLAGMSLACRQESEPVFQYLVGKYKKVAGFQNVDGAGTLVELDFRMKQNGEWRRHSVWIEPSLLRKRVSRRGFHERG